MNFRRTVVATTVVMAATSSSFAGNNITVEEIEAGSLSEAQAAVSAALENADNIPSSVVDAAVGTITETPIYEEGEERTVDVSSLTIESSGDIHWSGLVDDVEITQEIVGYTYDVTGVQAVVDTHYFFDSWLDDLVNNELDALRGAVGDRVAVLATRIEDLSTAASRAEVTQDWSAIDSEASAISAEIDSINAVIASIRTAYSAVDSLGG